MNRAGQPARLFQRLGQRRSLRVSMALADQAAVSGVNFLTSVIIGRTCGKTELGVFALGMSIVFVAMAAQQSLISAAHTVFSVRLQGIAWRRYNGAVAIQFASLCLLIMLVLGSAVLISGLASGSDATVTMLLALVVVCPCVLLREFSRRFEFARFNMAGALLLDVSLASLQLTVVGVLAYRSMLSGTIGLVAIATACGLAGGTWLLLNRSDFRISRQSLGDEFRRGWKFGRWLFGGQIALAMVGFTIQWTTAAMIDASAVGVYSACMMLVLLANPLVIGLQNLLSPSIAKAMHEGGRRGVRKLVAQSTAGLTLLMTLYWIVIVIIGDTLVTWLYGQAFAGNQWTVGLLVGGVLATSAGVSSNHGLRAIERTELNFWAALSGLVSGVSVAWWAIPSWGVAGAALGYVVACSLTSGVRIMGFLVASRDMGEAAA